MPYTSSVGGAGLSSAIASPLSANPLAVTNTTALASPIAAGALGGVGTSALAANDPLCQLLGISPATVGAAGISADPAEAMMIQMFGMMNTMLTELMGGGASPFAGFATQGLLAPAATTIGAPVVDPSQFFGLINDNSGQDQAKLQNYISLIASDPDGLALLQEANRRGVSIELGAPDNDPNVLGVTISNGNDARIIVRDLDTGLETLIHELGHAVSTEDGNSREEEGAVEALAAKITRNIDPSVAALSENNGLTLDQVAQQKSSLRAYQALMAQNNILGTLSRLGINVFG
ncbi:MAG: hypothetical protein AB7P76_03775 [Candidatus Melainabacteria bacterium]